MHGAPGSSFGPRPLGGPRIHLRTARRRSLTSTNPFKWLVIPRSRLSLSVAGLVLTFLLYTFLFGGSTQNGYLPSVYNRPPPQTRIAADDDYEEQNLDLVPADKVPDKLAEQFDLEDLPVLAPPHPNPKPVLARESVFSNPWPDAPKIASHWLSDERLNQDGGAASNWPTSRAKLDSAPKAVPTIAWKDLYRPSGYQGPIGLKDLPEDQIIKSSPTIQAEAFHESAEDIAIRRARQSWVRRAFKHAWGGYKSQAWGHDEVRPLTGHGNNPFNAWGATIIDSLSTLLLLNLTEEYSLARTHVRQVDFTVILGDKSVYSSMPDTRTVPVFETIIRYLGGLLSAYDLSGGDILMLERAEELAQLLMGAFDTRYGLPLGRYQLGSKLDGKYAGRQALAEVGSFSLEFGRLAQITGKDEYYDVVHRAMSHLAHGWKTARRWPGLLPTHPDDSKPDSLDGTYTLGALTDSYYEYLLKSSLLFRNSTAAEEYTPLYTAAIDAALSNGMVQKVGVVPDHNDLILIGQLKYDMYIPLWEHLTCYAGGLLAMGSKLLSRPKDLETGDKFTQTCVWAYDATWTGVGPETLTFYGAMDPRRYQMRKDGDGKTFLQVNGHPPGAEKGDRKSQSRPETIESVFYLWRITGDPIWQERGWRMFTDWVRYSISSFGFSGLNNVNSPRYRQVDSMESFVLAETLKYYYLLFADPDFMSLDEYVFNTEAHPLQMPLKDKGQSPKSFTPSWRVSQLDEDLRKIYDDFMEDTDGAGKGSWVQKYLSQRAFSKQD